MNNSDEIEFTKDTNTGKIPNDIATAYLFGFYQNLKHKDHLSPPMEIDVNELKSEVGRILGQLQFKYDIELKYPNLGYKLILVPVYAHVMHKKLMYEEHPAILQKQLDTGNPTVYQQTPYHTLLVALCIFDNGCTVPIELMRGDKVKRLVPSYLSNKYTDSFNISQKFVHLISRPRCPKCHTHMEMSSPSYWIDAQNMKIESAVGGMGIVSTSTWSRTCNCLGPTTRVVTDRTRLQLGVYGRLFRFWGQLGEDRRMMLDFSHPVRARVTHGPTVYTYNPEFWKQSVYY